MKNVLIIVLAVAVGVLLYVNHRSREAVKETEARVASLVVEFDTCRQQAEEATDVIREAHLSIDALEGAVRDLKADLEAENLKAMHRETRLREMDLQASSVFYALEDSLSGAPLKLLYEYAELKAYRF